MTLILVIRSISAGNLVISVPMNRETLKIDLCADLRLTANFGLQWLFLAAGSSPQQGTRLQRERKGCALPSRPLTSSIHHTGASGLGSITLQEKFLRLFPLLFIKISPLNRRGKYCITYVSMKFLFSVTWR